MTPSATTTPSPASMEPGHEDREYTHSSATRPPFALPQWSPVMKTGNTRSRPRLPSRQQLPQWSPVMKTGNTSPEWMYVEPDPMPQWSPVMKTGNTGETL